MEEMTRRLRSLIYSLTPHQRKQLKDIVKYIEEEKPTITLFNENKGPLLVNNRFTGEFGWTAKDLRGLSLIDFHREYSRNKRKPEQFMPFFDFVKTQQHPIRFVSTPAWMRTRSGVWKIRECRIGMVLMRGGDVHYLTLGRNPEENYSKIIIL